MGHVRLSWILAALCLGAACGDDDDDAKGGDAGTAGRGQGGGAMLRDPSAGQTGSDGTGSTVSGWYPEGERCSPSRVCAEGLSCMPAGLPQGLPSVSICARKCTDASEATDCGANERCYMVGSSGYCVNPVRTTFESCGPFETAYCMPPLACRYYNDDDPMTAEAEFFGACVQPCTPETDADGGAARSDCGEGQICDGRLDACVTVSRLGEPCGEGDRLCDEGLACILSNGEATGSCRQRCDNAGDVCTQGECVDVAGPAGAASKVCL